MYTFSFFIVTYFILWKLSSFIKQSISGGIALAIYTGFYTIVFSWSLSDKSSWLYNGALYNEGYLFLGMVFGPILLIRGIYMIQQYRPTSAKIRNKPKKKEEKIK